VSGEVEALRQMLLALGAVVPKECLLMGFCSGIFYPDVLLPREAEAERAG